MEKKVYIEPSATVRKVSLEALMQYVSGSGNTEHELPRDGGEAGEDVGSDARNYNGGHDVWED